MASTQAKRAIAKMKKAGFKRSDFRVRTQTRSKTHEGREYTEYGEALITCLAPKEEALAKVHAAIKAGLDVTFYSRDGYPYFSEAVGDRGVENKFWYTRRFEPKHNPEGWMFRDTEAKENTMECKCKYPKIKIEYDDQGRKVRYCKKCWKPAKEK